MMNYLYFRQEPGAQGLDGGGDPGIPLSTF